MLTMDDHSAARIHLPGEILLMIIGLVSTTDWKQLRLTCRRFNNLITPLLFQRVYFEFCASGCESLYNISRNQALSPCVQTLVLRRVRGYLVFPNFESWASSVHQPGDPGHELDSSSDEYHCNIEHLGDGLLPYTEWMAMTKEQKEALYLEYEADRKKLRKEVRNIQKTMRFRMPDTSRSALVHTRRASTTAASAAVEQFCKAIETLPNLKAFEHEPGILWDNDWACRWRCLYLHPWLMDGRKDCFEDESIEALQLSVVLHSLACVRREDRRLTKLSMYVGGPAFVTAEDLCILWDGDEDEMTWDDRDRHSNAAEEYNNVYSDNVTSEQSNLYYGQLNVMRHAMAGLTHLDYVMSGKSDSEGSLEIAAKFVFHFLTAAKDLERLRLVFGTLANGILMPTSEREWTDDSIKLLDQLTRHSPWNRLRDIELETATDRTTLMRFLLAHKDTLRSLALTRVSLVGPETPINKLNLWEVTLAEIAQRLSLKSITLSKLCDFPQDTIYGARQRVLFDSKAKFWQGKINEYRGYYDAAVGRILRRETGDSLNLDAFERPGAR